MDAGIAGSGNIGAKATPCLEFSAYLSRIVRADERSWRQGIALTHCDYQRLPV
jgi:hypothetical protein